MNIISVRENKDTKEYSKTRQLENITRNDDNTIEEAFFKIVCSFRGKRNYRHLKQLLLLYTQNVLSNMENNVEFDPINLKTSINNILIFFHLYWLDIKQEITDHSLYLNKMSALLSIYIDMELETSRQEIDVKILAALYIYLNNSEEHIFRVLLRIKNMTKKYMKICNHIFTKSFTNLKIKRQDKRSLNDVAYIRYLLAFKMWKKISDKNEKIDELALKLLGPCMPKLRDELIKFVPSPMDRTDHKTLWLLKSDIDLKEMHEHFLLFEDQMDKLQFEDQMDIHSLQFEDEINNSAYLQCIKATDQNSLKSQVSLSINGNKSLEEIYLQKKKKRNLESLKKITKKAGEIEIIDLTGDDETNLYKVKRKKRKKHNLKDQDCLNIRKESSNGDRKSTVKKVCLEHEFIKNEKFDNSYYSTSILHNHNLYIKECNVTSNVLKDHKPENLSHHDVSHITYMTGNAIGSYNNSTTQKTSQKESVIDIIPSLKMCQNDIENQHSFKHEINTNCNATQKSCKCYEPMPVGEHIICMIRLNNNEHIYVVHRYPIDDMSVVTCSDIHAEKKMQHLDKSNDNTVPTTSPENQMIESSLYNQHVHTDNVKMNDKDIAKYSKVTIQEQQKSDSSILNDQVHFLELYMSDNSFKIDSNAEIDYDLKNFSNIEEINYTTMLNDCDKYVYVSANHVGECVMAKSAEKRNNSDMYTASTTFMKDQIVHDSKHSESTIKAQQERNNCDTLNEISNGRLHLFKHNIFNIDSIDMDESISFSHQIKISEILENVVSNETIEFLLSLK